jgi:RNA polymerase sigma-70 factor (ECF subfamily)
MTRTARQPSHPGIGPAAWRSSASTNASDEAAARRDRDRHLATLLAATASGDTGAFEAFYEATFAYARTVARRLLRDSAAIEDLLSECYFEAWRSAGHFDQARGSPVTWLLTLVRSRGLDALRAAAARPDRAAGEGSAGLPGRHAEGDGAEKHAAADSPDTDPAERLWRRESGAVLNAALAALSAPERWVLGLAYLRELSHAEIARCTGMPLGTVKSHALRAQNKLRALLAPGTMARDGGDGTSTPPP